MLRVWLYQTYTRGGTDFASFDRLLTVAKKHNIRILGVLDDMWDYCSDGPNKTLAWFQNGYRAPWGQNPLSYRDYAGRVVSRYKDDPGIFAWSLMNEPDPIVDHWEGKWPVWAEGKSATQAFRDWVEDMGNYVKSLDRNHLLTIGTVGAEWQDYLDYVGVHSLPAIDFCEVHDYDNETVALPPRVDARLNQCVGLAGKPLIVGESSIRLIGPRSFKISMRAQLFNAKLQAFFENGGAGYLIWEWGKSLGTGSAVQFGDPMLPVLRGYSTP